MPAPDVQVIQTRSFSPPPRRRIATIAFVAARVLKWQDDKPRDECLAGRTEADHRSPSAL
jgi:hypothetical protein